MDAAGQLVLPWPPPPSEALEAALQAAAPPSSTRARYACVVFDFDSTLSQPFFLRRFDRWAIAGTPGVCSDMTEHEIVENFGGRNRLGRLRTLLAKLAAARVHTFIISIGYKEAILPHLHVAGLAEFFHCDNAFGLRHVD